MGEENVEGDDVDLGPVHALMAFPELERNQYCMDVVKALADSVEQIVKIKGKIKQAKAAKVFWKDLQEKRDEIQPVLFYIIKPEFRETVLELMERFADFKV